MHRAFLVIGVAFLAVGVASATVASGIVWSTFVTLGVAFLALAFAFRDGDGGEHASGEDADATRGGSSSVDEDV
ncbi:hypothetical protein [Halorubellus sp. PRR65]|uniref:hypothetical protein n=1 Tax=Halorubellus sp. PRR65 TaxID=3098148 RepID=UPI002B262C8C|nr:hypothetical protein [Halorubellus sp. PRR65]